MFSSLPFSYLFLCMMSLGTLLSVSSVHWLGIWAGLEINLIGFLPMLIYQKSVSESESAVKYFMIQALGSSFLMLGSLSFFNLSFSWEMGNELMMETFGPFILFSGLFMKLGVFPFHYWLPSVMAGLPWFTCLLLATWQKLAPIFLLLCLFEVSQSKVLVVMVLGVSVGSSLIGGIGGMNQTQIRPLLAYSSIGHLGWMSFTLTQSEWTLKVYFVIYIFVSIFLFLSLWMSNPKEMKNINNMNVMMVPYFCVMILLLSLGGLPPLLGFIPKWLVISAGVENSWLLIILFLIVGSLMSLFYYLSLFFSMMFSLIKKEDLYYKSSWNMFMVSMISLNILGGAAMLFVSCMMVM
uniref:NADH-ubiquinone oxidoreductase chain 2 n=1 Tax=Mitromorpha fischeri TaxID=2259836 RepID=A0A344H1V0_9COND|nr:NADH dehydrogenase subunit 2 [Mitromorpha fischeri]